MSSAALRTFGRPFGAAVLLLVGAVAHLRHAAWAGLPWWAGLLGLGLPVVLRTGVGLVRGRFAADVVASLSILVAIALDQPLSGLVIVLMQTGGEALDRYAEGRASAAVRALEAEAPRRTHRRGGEGWEEVAVEQVAVGDELLVRPGEMVPCDGVVTEGRSDLDTSRLTGEPLPRRIAPGTEVESGVVNLSSPFQLRATRPAGASQYAQVVRLVRDAQASKAPLQREADRWAVWFTPVTLLACAATYFASHDPLRVLAVLVVATPCPLILAAPVAIIGGIDRGARHGLVFRTGASLETLGRVTAVVLDKTGTLTIGRPAVAEVRPVDHLAPDRLLALAAAVESGAGHPLGRSVVAAALDRRLALPAATEVIEAPGQGIAGLVDGHRVAVGGERWVGELIGSGAPAARADGGLIAAVAIDGALAGRIHFADRVRPEAARTLAALRAQGLGRQLLLSGDDPRYTRQVAEGLGIPDAEGGLRPADKLERIRHLQRAGARVVMVGDGTNDAPALSAADVGVALAAHGGGVSAEAAGLVLLHDDLSRLPLAIALSRRTVRVARQSIGVGLGFSALGMVLAGLGILTPVAGAFTQEAIDVAVILWALRASAPLAAG